jgi:hypothetical protein
LRKKKEKLEEEKSKVDGNGVSFACFTLFYAGKLNIIMNNW